MEYIEGQSLKQKILEGPLNQAEAIDIAIQVAEGLEEAHRKGIVHRDIKPGNIMVTEKGQVKVMDFGLAKVLGGSLSTMAYKGSKKRIPEIAKELGVAAIVEGTTVRSGNIIRINIQLIDGKSDKNLWADSFDREYRDVLKLQSETALAIAQKIQASLTPEETKILERTRPVNPEAFEAYLKGMFVFGRLNQAIDMRPDLEKCIQYFEQARTIDPNFALAYAGLALTYDFLAFAGSPKEAWPKAEQAALKALSLDESISAAHAVLADMKASNEWDWLGADKEFRRALELNPNLAIAHYFYAIFLCGQRRNEDAISHAGRALELDPFTPTTIFYVIAVYGLAGQNERAIAVAKESLRLFPNDAGIRFWLILLYHYQGMDKEAYAEYQKLIDLGLPPNSISIYISALLGEKSKAGKALEDLLMQPQGMMPVDPFLTAAVYVLLGENDKAFEWLERCLEQRNSNLQNLNVIPIFESLHGDLRFAALLNKIGLKGR